MEKLPKNSDYNKGVLWSSDEHQYTVDIDFLYFKLKPEQTQKPIINQDYWL